MKILDAIDYMNGRKVVQVWMNDSDPALVHADGSIHRKSQPTELGDLVSPANLIRIQANPDKLAIYEAILAKHQADKTSALKWCILCVDNRKVLAFQFEEDELTKKVEVGFEDPPPQPDDWDVDEKGPWEPKPVPIMEIQDRTDAELMDIALDQAGDTVAPAKRQMVR